MLATFGGVLTSLTIGGVVASPLAAIGDLTGAAIVGGVFGFINLVYIERIRRATAETRQIVEQRHEQVPPPDGTYKRATDPPKGHQ